MNNNKIIKRIVRIAVLSGLVIGLEELLIFIPNVQLTVFLLILYSKKLKFSECSIIIFIYTIIDSLIMSSFNIIFTSVMYVSWLMIPIIIKTIFNKTENVLLLGISALIVSLIYSWINAIPGAIYCNMNYFKYIISEISFEIILCISSIISTIILYKPLSIVSDKYITHNN